MCSCQCHGWARLNVAPGCRCEGCPNRFTDSTVDVPLPVETETTTRTYHRILTREENALVGHVRDWAHESQLCRLCQLARVYAEDTNLLQTRLQSALDSLVGES